MTTERWCEGLCERLLPPAAFRFDRRYDKLRTTCRDCERAMSRVRNRRRYHTDAVYRQREIERGTENRRKARQRQRPLQETAA